MYIFDIIYDAQKSFSKIVNHQLKVSINPTVHLQAAEIIKAVYRYLKNIIPIHVHSE
jgi:hypothetical protein